MVDDGNKKKGENEGPGGPGSIDENWARIADELRSDGAGAPQTPYATAIGTTTTPPKNGTGGTNGAAAAAAKSGLEGAVNAPDFAKLHGAGNGHGQPLTAKAKELGLLEGINLPGTEKEIDNMQKDAEETPKFLEQKMTFLAQVNVQDYYGTVDSVLLSVAQKMGSRVYGGVQGWVDKRVKQSLKDMVKSDLGEQATKLRANAERYQEISGQLSKVGERYSQRSIVGDAMLQQETYPQIAKGYEEIERLKKDLAAATQKGDFTSAHAARKELHDKEKEVTGLENSYERIDYRVKASQTAIKAVQGLIERADRYASTTQRYLMAVEEKIGMLGMVDEIANIQFDITPARLDNLDGLLGDAGNIISAIGCDINDTIQAGGDPARGPDLKPDYLASDAEVMRTESYRHDRRARIERLHSERVSRLNEAATTPEGDSPVPAA